MFWKKDTKNVSKNTKAKTKKTAAGKGRSQTGKTAAKNIKQQAGKPAAQGGKTQEKSDAVLAKLKAIEQEMSLEEARDRVDELESEKIAASIEELLKMIGSGK